MQEGRGGQTLGAAEWSVKELLWSQQDHGTKVTVLETSSVRVWQLGEAGRKEGEKASLYNSSEEIGSAGGQRYGAVDGWRVECRSSVLRYAIL